jgi:glycerol-3-phosphate acyltransferase PlsY
MCRDGTRALAEPATDGRRVAPAEGAERRDPRVGRHVASDRAVVGPVLDSRPDRPLVHAWSDMDGATLILDLALVVGAYLCGSIPMGVVVARLTGGVDPRTVGSGRTGGTNALRALGRKRAAAVVIGDLLKGAVPVLVARVVAGQAVIEVLCGLAAVSGAIWSVFVGFRSGRGVGTGVGTMLVIQPVAVLLAAPVFVLVIVVTRYVSLGSLLASAALFPAMLIVWAVASAAVAPQYLVYAVIGPALIWVAHADNIERLIHGTERKFDLGMLSGRGGSGEH